MTNIWVPKSHENPNPNPNPKITAITQPSSSKSPKSKRNNKKTRKNRKITKEIKPNWLNLLEDVWLLILSKLSTIEIIENVQKVCKLFRKICIQPSMFKRIDMTLHDAYMDLEYDVNIMTRYAVDRSAGELLDIYLEYLCDDDTLMYIVDRSKKLKHLRLGHYIYISDDGLIEAVKKLPMIEEVEIIICSFTALSFEALGYSCPSLKSFTINHVASRQTEYIFNEEAFGIAKSMPNLHRLQLIGNCMSNEGLKAILDGCPLLESLDLRACFLIDLSGNLGKRCDKIKHLRRPSDSTADYSHQACTDDEIADHGWLDQSEFEYGYD